MNTENDSGVHNLLYGKLIESWSILGHDSGIPTTRRVVIAFGCLTNELPRSAQRIMYTRPCARHKRSNAQMQLGTLVKYRDLLGK